MRSLRCRCALAECFKTSPIFTLLCSGLTALLICAIQSSVQAQVIRTPSPTRRYVVQGKVSLPDDKPAPNVRVRLMSAGGLNRETLTNDNGRYEFADVSPGTYFLTASSITDTSLSSESVETDTSQTLTGNLSVDLFLRSNKAGAVAKPRPGVISVAEADQRVPKEARKAFKQGLKLKIDNQPDDALLSFNRAIELYPEYFQALAERGELYVAKRKLAEAADDFERALKVNADYEPALRGAGYCKLESKNFTEAVKYLERAKAVAPENASIYLLLGIADLELDRREPALKALQQALSIDALRAVRAHIYLGNLYAREGQYQKAADELQTYLEAVPADPDSEELRKVEAQWRARQDK